MADDYVIYVGGKPFMNYVTAVVMQFTTKGADNVIIRSRGKFINRAVDVAEVVKSRFLKEQIKVGDISIGSEEFQNKEGKTVRVSTLDIVLTKTGKKVKGTKPITKVEAPPVEETPKQTPEEPAEETTEEAAE